MVGEAQELPAADSAPAVTTEIVRPTVRPLPAFFRSLVLPGWGQAILDRKLTAGLFMAWEGITLSMALKAHREVQRLERTEDTRIPAGSMEESERLQAKKAEREDWLVLLAFNHLFSGLEAFVSAHLWDFPEDVRIRAVPIGSSDSRNWGVQVSIPVRFR